MCISLSTTVVHSTVQTSSDNFPSYPPDNRHSSDDVYWRAGDEDMVLMKLFLTVGYNTWYLLHLSYMSYLVGVSLSLWLHSTLYKSCQTFVWKDVFDSCNWLTLSRLLSAPRQLVDWSLTSLFSTIWLYQRQPHAGAPGQTLYNVTKHGFRILCYGLFWFTDACLLLFCLIWFLQYRAKWSSEKNVSEITCFVSNGK